LNIEQSMQKGTFAGDSFILHTGGGDRVSQVPDASLFTTPRSQSPMKNICQRKQNLTLHHHSLKSTA